MTARFTQFKLVGPAIILIAILLTGLAAVPYYGVARLDAKIRERQETLVKRNISIWISDVEFALTAWTIWDESIAKLDNSYDPEWADRNIGSSLIGTSRTRFAAILDAGDYMIYSKTADEVLNRPFFLRGAEVITKDAGSLVAHVREREAGVRATGIPNPVAFSKIEVIGSDAVLLTASLFQPDFRTATPRGARAPVLVSAVPIAGSLQEFLGNRFLLDDAAIGPLNAVSPDRARAEIAVGQDGQPEVLSWRPLTPARDLLMQSLPLVASVAIVLVAGGLFVARLSRRAVVSLVEAEQRMRHAATHDFLTGLANRSMIATEFARLSSAGSLTVACLDLDGFKSVNDRYGHAAGDELLKQVAARLRAGTRQDDMVFRLGGDEFAILMPSVPLGEAEWRCRQLSSLLSQPYVLDGIEASVGASFGLGEVPPGAGESCDDALKRADGALYAAKAKGRGTVVASSGAGFASNAANSRSRLR
ncbi:diguanylate cyclase [Rhizobium sp. S96]|uniref:GGDEF domain-containing protein n=1 Tax=Rhizobium sp. S96 TaxID=3055140 RepID=UPI0025AA8CF9|nr:diguanylate cyclase [Rhizobium sp. S96]MDM9622634.1 diguanylate cyclase [Rhizobium sp. S96]